jgi:hypothetical protein
MIEAICEMTDEGEKERLINIVANHMKKSYLIWNRDSVNDEVVLNDLKKLSKGAINTENIKLNEVRDVITKKRSKRHNRRK